MSTVAEVAVEYGTKGAQSAIRADRSVRDSIQDTAKTAQSEAGTIDRWMERHKSAIQAIGVATAGALGSILAASPTMRAELSSARIAFSLFADTVVNDVLPPGESLADVMFDLEESYRDLPEPVRTATSTLMIFAGAAALASFAIGPVAGALILAVGAFVALQEAISPAAGLLGATVVLAGALLVLVGPLAAGIMLLAGAAVTVASQFNLVELAIIAVMGIGLILLPFLGTLGVALILLGMGAAALYEMWTNNWLGIRDITGSVVGRVTDGVAWMNDFIHADTGEKIEMIKDLWRGFESWVGDLGSGVADSFSAAWNNTIPASLSLPELDFGPAGSYGGGSVSLPRLRHGGEIERGGLARLHAGEQVVPAAEVSSSSGGGAGGGTTILNVEQHIESGGSPRRTADKSADAVSQTIQDEFGMRR